VCQAVTEFIDAANWTSPWLNWGSQHGNVDQPGVRITWVTTRTHDTVLDKNWTLYVACQQLCPYRERWLYLDGGLGQFPRDLRNGEVSWSELWEPWWGEAQPDLVAPGPTPDHRSFVRGQVVQDHVDRRTIRPRYPDRLQRGEGIDGALLAVIDAPQGVVADGVRNKRPSTISGIK
jgi:hypothetical protein